MADTPPPTRALASEPPPAPQAGRLGRFPIVGELGEGGMGQVLCVEDEQVGRRMAAKIVRASDSPRAVQMFLREARLTGQLEHPNIVPMHELGVTPEGQHYYTMKQVDGRTLSEVLSAAPAPSLATLLRIVIKVCDALDYAHSKGVIHRDLKPDNVMVGRFGEVLVMDWGLAKVVGQPDAPQALSARTEPSTHRSLDGDVMGTPAYMPPEQARGQLEQLDGRSDIYALGAILYEVLTHRPPYVGDSALVVLTQLLSGAPARPSSVCGPHRVPWELEAVVLKAMAREATDRYPTVAALESDLLAFLEGRMVEAASYAPWQRAGRWLRRHWRLVAGVALLCAAAVLWRHQQLQARRDQFAHLVASARRQLRAGAVPPDLPARPSRAETLAQRRVRERALAAHLAASSQLDQALSLFPEDAPARRLRRAAGRDLSRIALAGRDFNLARQARLDLARFGEPRPRIDAFLQHMEALAQGQLTRQRRRILEILADVAAGFSRPDRAPTMPSLDDYVFEVVTYRDRQTVELLGQALNDQIRRASRRPNRRLTQPEIEVADFCCRVLGRLRLATSVTALTRWLAGVQDPGLIIQAGTALCRTGRPEAYAPLKQLERRLGANSTTWRQIRVHLHQVPEPAVSPSSGQTAEQHVARGVFRMDQARLAEAEGDFGQAITLRPRWAVPYDLRGQVRVRLGRREAGLRDLDRAVALDPDDAMGRVNRGSLYHDLGRLEEALADLTRAVTLRPDLAAARVNRGALLSALKRYAEARQDLDVAIRLDPRLAEAYVNRASVFVAQGADAEALEDLDRAIQLSPKLAIAYANRGHARARMGNHVGARADFDQAIKIDPHHLDALVGRGNLHLARRRFPEALADYERARRIDPDDPRPRVNRAAVAMRMGRPGRAITEYTAAIARHPRYAPAYAGRGTAYLRSGQLDQARHDLDRALGLDPSYAPAHDARGLLRDRLRDPKGALADFDRAIRLAPRQAQPYVNRGITLHRLKRYAAAAADFSRAIELRPEMAQAWGSRGLARVALGKLEDGLADYDRSLKLAAEARTLYNRSLVLRRLGHARRALADLDRALKIDRTYRLAWTQRGRLRFDAEQYADAERDFRQAIELAPTLDTGWEALGMAQARQNKRPEALASLKRALSLAPPARQGRLRTLIRQLER